MEKEVTLLVYLFGTLIVGISLSAILVLIFWISEKIVTNRERKKRKTVWDLGEK